MKEWSIILVNTVLGNNLENKQKGREAREENGGNV